MSRGRPLLSEVTKEKCPFDTTELTVDDNIGIVKSAQDVVVPKPCDVAAQTQTATESKKMHLKDILVFDCMVIRQPRCPIGISWSYLPSKQTPSEVASLLNPAPAKYCQTAVSWQIRVLLCDFHSFNPEMVVI